MGVGLGLLLACNARTESRTDWPISEASGTSDATTSTSGDACPADATGTCVERLEAAVGIGETPAPLCGEALQRWSALELCFIDCDAQFPPPDDEGFCACLLTSCADLLAACGEGAAAVCDHAGADSTSSSSGDDGSGSSSAATGSSGTDDATSDDETA